MSPSRSGTEDHLVAARVREAAGEDDVAQTAEVVREDMAWAKTA